MDLPIRLISTDFDGTLHADHEDPPVPLSLQELLAELQHQGVTWVINTGRDLTSLMEGMARARLQVRPDYLVLVEREIYIHRDHRYEPVTDWNERCSDDHARLFERLGADLPRLVRWISDRYDADVYQDPYSPFCLIARNTPDAEAICHYLEDYCREAGDLQVVRNDVYARFAHVGYSKGTALAEIASRLGVSVDETFAAGDHVNDLPMLDSQVAAHLAAPANAVAEVKAAVRGHGGYVCERPCGHGVEEALRRVLNGH
jgi:HAD superfamily hydrolase (TIGR01484 family)